MTDFQAIISPQGRTATPQPPPMSGHGRGAAVAQRTAPRPINHALEKICRERGFAHMVSRIHRRWPSLDAEDVVQDALASLLQSNIEIAPDCSIYPLVWVTCCRRAIDQHRRDCRRPTEPLVEQDAPTYSVENTVNAQLDIDKLLSVLPAAQRIAVNGAQLLGLSAKEIETRFGQSANAVRVNVHRGLSRLREQVGAISVRTSSKEGSSHVCL